MSFFAATKTAEPPMTTEEKAEYYSRLEEDHRLSQELFADDPALLEGEYKDRISTFTQEELVANRGLMESIEVRLAKAADMNKTIKFRWHHTQLAKIEISALENKK